MKRTKFESLDLPEGITEEMVDKCAMSIALCNGYNKDSTFYVDAMSNYLTPIIDMFWAEARTSLIHYVAAQKAMS